MTIEERQVLSISECLIGKAWYTRENLEHIDTFCSKNMNRIYPSPGLSSPFPRLSVRDGAGVPCMPTKLEMGGRAGCWKEVDPKGQLRASPLWREPIP